MNFLPIETAMTHPSTSRTIRYLTATVLSLGLWACANAQDQPRSEPPAPPQAQAAPPPPLRTSAAEKVRFPSLDRSWLNGAAVPVEAYLFRPDPAGPHPAVIFLHGCGGLLDRRGEINGRELAWASRLTAAGYVVLMVDSYATRDVTNMCAPASFRPEVYRARPKDAYGALRYLQSQPFVRPDRIGLIGWSLGGGTILLTISDRDSLGRPADLPQGDFRAAVAFYPATCDTSKLKAGWSSRIPLLVLVGEGDVWTPAQPCKVLIDKAAAAGSPVSIRIYPGAYHDFDWPGLPVRHLTPYRTNQGVVPVTGMDPAARDDAYRRVSDFLTEYLDR
jgi:dienelactone hydrolase